MAIKTTLYNYVNSASNVDTVHTAPTTPILETHPILFFNVTNLHASNDIRIIVKHVRSTPAITTAIANQALIPFGMSLTLPEPGQKWTLEPGDSITVTTGNVADNVDITLSYGII